MYRRRFAFEGPSVSQPSDSTYAHARYLVESNKDRYPELLIEQLAQANHENSEACARATFAEEMVRVALRMLKRAGKLKATTDDERAAVELAGYMIDLPAANRRLLHPLTDDYVTRAVDVGRQLTLDTSSQDSVNEEAA
jgi:hypothetical protein